MNGYAIRTWSAVCSIAPHSQFGEGARPHFVRGRMESRSTHPQAIELNPSCLGQAHFNRPDTAYEYESTDTGSTLTGTLCSIYNTSTEKRGYLVRQGCLIDSVQLAQTSV